MSPSEVPCLSKGRDSEPLGHPVQAREALGLALRLSGGSHPGLLSSILAASLDPDLMPQAHRGPLSTHSPCALLSTPLGR